MKKFACYSILACVFMLTTASTCSNDDDDSPSPTPTNANPQPVINTASAGTWRITYYYDTDSEETGQFSNYNFTFGPSNVLTAVNGSTTVTGSWSVTDSNSSSDDDSSSDLDFNISFASPSNFEELSDDWDIVSYSANKIELIDVSGGNGGTDLLTFEKN